MRPPCSHGRRLHECRTQCRRPISHAEDQAREIADNLLALPKEQRLAALESHAAGTLVNFPNQLRGDQRDRLFADFSPQEREIFRALANPAGVVVSRTAAGENDPRDLFRAAIARSDDRFLVQPLQCLSI